MAISVINQQELPEGFELIKPLGRGGNAKVACVFRNGKKYAMKLLENYKKTEAASYKRFANEIQALQQFQDDPGIMTICEMNLPERPSKTNRPWFTMPVAAHIRDELSNPPSFRLCIEAVSEICNTLIRLKARNLGHRDIKPDNLFKLNGRWVIGDFGLCSLPNSIMDITEQEGRPLGSRQFMAPEMSTDPANASPFHADVWSVAKTLWSLVTGNPHPSYLSFEMSHDRLDTYGVQIQGSYLIDRVLEQATLRNPEDRISIEEFVNELENWLDLSEKPPLDLETGDLATKMQILMRPTIIEKHKQVASIDSAKDVLEKIAPRFSEIREALAKNYGEKPAETGFVDEVHFGKAGFSFQFCDLSKSDGLAQEEGFFTVNASLPAKHQLRFGLMIQVMHNFDHRLFVHIVFNNQGKSEIFWQESIIVPHSTPTEYVSINRLIDNLMERTRPALIRLNELIDSQIE